MYSSPTPSRIWSFCQQANSQVAVSAHREVCMHEARNGLLFCVLEYWCVCVYAGKGDLWLISWMWVLKQIIKFVRYMQLITSWSSIRTDLGWWSQSGCSGCGWTNVIFFFKRIVGLQADDNVGRDSRRAKYIQVLSWNAIFKVVSSPKPIWSFRWA